MHCTIPYDYTDPQFISHKLLYDLLPENWRLALEDNGVMRVWAIQTARTLSCLSLIDTVQLTVNMVPTRSLLPLSQPLTPEINKECGHSNSWSLYLNTTIDKAENFTSKQILSFLSSNSVNAFDSYAFSNFVCQMFQIGKCYNLIWSLFLNETFSCD